MIVNTRLLSQQLANPSFKTPKELVSWMGAVQAQDYNMAKWAVGVRLPSANLQTVEQALVRGDMLRTHILRPTWHLVAAENIRWMLKLTAHRIKSGSVSRDRDLEITESLYTRCNLLLEKMLANNNHLTRQEIGQELGKEGIATNCSRMIHFMMRAEVEGIVCNGVDKGNKTTYALIDERVPPTKELHKDEALAKLASIYFRSHSPASLADFAWWSGLSMTEAREAMSFVKAELVEDRFESSNLFLHQSWNEDMQAHENLLHHLPAFDEYLISYKDRTDVLNIEHYSKAFTNNGIFYPVIVYNGKVVGRWGKTKKKGKIEIETSFFEPHLKIDQLLMENAIEKYTTFISLDIPKPILS